jgi:transposase InsO family protein
LQFGITRQYWDKHHKGAISPLCYQQSTSFVINCVSPVDNADIESFWATLKKELVYQTVFATREQVHSAIFEFIEVFYNGYHLHSSLDYTSPTTFEARLDAKLLALAA